VTEKILVSLSFHTRVPAATQIADRLRAKGWEVVLNSSGKNMTEADLVEALPGISGVIAGSDSFTARALAAGNRLKVIARVGVGYDDIDLAAATHHGIVVVTTPTQEIFEAMADLTFGLMVAVSRRIAWADSAIKAGQWRRMDLLGPHLFHRTLGIIGLGRIGKEVARIARAFKMEILCYDVMHDDAFAAEVGLKYVGLPDLLREADYVSIHTPLTPATQRLMNRERLQLMKPTAYLINTSRGPVVDEEALLWALTNGIIAGAAADVFQKEPVPADNPLVKLENFVATPHIGGLSLQAMDSNFAAAAQSVGDVLEGKRPNSVVNPDVYSVAGGNPR
jgi:phosphoglycerate dehydrogenase-like enzyme